MAQGKPKKVGSKKKEKKEAPKRKVQSRDSLLGNNVSAANQNNIGGIIQKKIQHHQKV